MKKVIIIGGGASGLVCAIVAARRGECVTILEKSNNCGKKILVSGNGRCNYWNSEFDITKFNSNNLDILEYILKNKDNVLPFFESLGIIPKIKNGYYYPYSNQSITVLNVLINELKRLNVNIEYDVEIVDIIKNNDSFYLISSNKKYVCDYVVVSTGSNAYVKDNTCGYDMLKRLGHSLIKPLPALVQLKGNDSCFKDWAGIRCDVNLSLYVNDKFIKCEIGEVQLTNYGISGICAMQLSSMISRCLYNNEKCMIKINFLNFLNSLEEFIDWLKCQSKKTNNKTIQELLDCVLNYKLTNIILKKSGIKNNKLVEQLTSNELTVLAQNVISFDIEIIDTMTFKESQVCSGGIPLCEINKDTLESLKVKNLYLTGEILDVDGNCGGYNLGFAWISGIIVGNSIGR